MARAHRPPARRRVSQDDGRDGDRRSFGDPGELTGAVELDVEALKSKEAWDRAALADAGFVGWCTFGDLEDELPSVAATGGVYIVAREGGEPEFLEANPGGRFKGRDPSVPDDALRANWVGGASVVYIGKADNLRRRLREFMRFGAGAPIGHWGGRLIWQLADSATLLVAWRETPDHVAKEIETELLGAFRAAWGKPPFANEPHRLGA